MPYENVTVLQRSWTPQKHWESEGVRHEKGAILYTSRSCCLHFLISRSIVHENKERGELNTSAQKCTEEQLSTGTTSDLFFSPRRGEVSKEEGAGSCLQQAYLGHAFPLQEWR